MSSQTVIRIPVNYLDDVKNNKTIIPSQMFAKCVALGELWCGFAAMGLCDPIPLDTNTKKVGFGEKIEYSGVDVAKGLFIYGRLCNLDTNDVHNKYNEFLNELADSTVGSVIQKMSKQTVTPKKHKPARVLKTSEVTRKTKSTQPKISTTRHSELTSKAIKLLQNIRDVDERTEKYNKYLEMVQSTDVYNALLDELNTENTVGGKQQFIFVRSKKPQTPAETLSTLRLLAHMETCTDNNLR